MPPIRVALDLETTGLDPVRDAIIEVGAVKFRESEVIGEFSTFVNPGRPVPRMITELTGIRDSDVATAPSVQYVLPRLVHFIGDFPIVGHNIRFDVNFLRQAATRSNTDAFHNPSLDTFELAGVLLPKAERYNLGELARLHGIDVGHSHRAFDDAVTTQRLFQALLERAGQLPPDLLGELLHHAERTGWEVAPFFRQALGETDRPPERYPRIGSHVMAPRSYRLMSERPSTRTVLRQCWRRKGHSRLTSANLNTVRSRSRC